MSGAHRAAPGHHLRGPGRGQDGRELRRHEPRYLAERKVRRGGAWVRLAGDRCRDRTSAARPGFGDRTAFLSRWRETGVLLQPNGRDATLGMGHEDPPGTAVDIATRRRGRRSADADRKSSEEGKSR